MTVTLITGANRGLGRETARQLIAEGHNVYVGARTPEPGEAAAAELGARFVQLDVTDDASVQAALSEIDSREGHLDVLINNAGVWDRKVGSGGVTGADALKVFDTNPVGVIRVTEAAIPLLRKSENPVIVNVSSALGSFYATTSPDRHEGDAPYIVYGASKAAVSMLTVQYAKALPEFKVNAAEPGFSDTDFTAGFEGGAPPQESVKVIVRLATLDSDGPTGTFEENAGVLPW